jgi:hypothetical protein
VNCARSGSRRGVVAGSDRDPQGRGAEQAQACPGDGEYLHERLGQLDRQPGRSCIIVVCQVGKGTLESIDHVHRIRNPFPLRSVRVRRLVIERCRLGGCRLLTFAVVRALVRSDQPRNAASTIIPAICRTRVVARPNAVAAPRGWPRPLCGQGQWCSLGACTARGGVRRPLQRSTVCRDHLRPLGGRSGGCFSSGFRY